MYYKKLCKALLLIVLFSPAVAKQSVLDERLQIAYINTLPGDGAVTLPTDEAHKNIQKVLRQLNFYRGLIQGNSTLTSYQLQQEKLAALEEELAILYQQRGQSERSVSAYARALEHYRNLAGVETGNKLKWFWLQVSVQTRMISMLKAMGEISEAVKQARQATSLYLKLLQENPDSQFLHNELAGHYFSVAQLLILNDEPAAAQALYQQAYEQYESLLAQQSARGRQYTDMEARGFRLLEIKSALAGIRSLDDSGAGIRAYEQLIDEVQQFILDVPDKPSHRAYLAEGILIPLAVLYLESGEIQSALDARRQADSIFMQLARSNPDANSIISAMAANQVQLAEQYKLLGQVNRAIDVFKSAREHYENLLQKEPQNTRWKHYLGITAGAIGELYSERGNYGLVTEFQQQSVRLASELNKEDPLSVKWAQLLLVAHWRDGQAYFAQKQFPKALAAYQQALLTAQRILKLAPDDAGNRSVVAEAHESLATTYKQLDPEGMTTEQAAEALRHDTEALQHYIRLAEEATNEADSERQLLLVTDQYLDIAVLHQGQLRHAEAIKLCETVLGIHGSNEGVGTKESSHWLSRVALSHALIAQNQLALEEEAAALEAFDSAHDYYLQLIRLEPVEPLWKNLLAASLMLEAGLLQSRKDYPASIRRYQQSLGFYQSLSDNQPENQQHTQSKLSVFIKLGDTYAAKHDRLAALDAYRQAEMHNLALQPESAKPEQQWLVHQHHILSQQARNFAMTGDMAEAINKYREINELIEQAVDSTENPDAWRGTDIMAWLDLGNIYRNHGNTEQADYLFSQSLKELQADKLRPESETYSFMRYVLLQTYLYNGLLAQKLGEVTEAGRHFDLAEQIITEQLNTEPDSREWQVEQLIMALYRGDFLQLNNRSGEALELFRQVERLLDTFLEAEPDNTDYLFYLALNYERLGQIYFDNGELEATKAAYRSEQDLYRRLLHSDPQQVYYQQGLSENYRRLAVLYYKQKKHPLAISTLEKAQAMTRELLLRSPGFIDWQFNLVRNYFQFGRVWAARGDHKNAATYFQLTIDETIKLIELNPEIVEWQAQLANSYYEFATLPTHSQQQKDSLLVKAHNILRRLDEQGRLYPIHQQQLKLTQPKTLSLR